MCGPFEDTQCVPTVLGGRINIHFHGQARAALRELRGEFNFHGLAMGLFFQDLLHGRLRQRRKMKLEAARNDGRQKRIGRGRGEDERRRTGRLLEHFQEHVGDVPAHGLRAIEDEDAAPAHGLKVGRALNSAQLAHAQHGARDGTLQTDRIGHEGPHIWVRLQDQRHTLDRGRVGALAPLDESLFEQCLRIGELGDALTSGALPAEIVRKALAIRGLCKHTRESEFAHAPWPREEQRVGDAFTAQGPAERRYNALVPEKLGKTHTLALLTRGSR